MEWRIFPSKVTDIKRGERVGLKLSETTIVRRTQATSLFSNKNLQMWKQTEWTYFDVLDKALFQNLLLRIMKTLSEWNRELFCIWKYFVILSESQE